MGKEQTTERTADRQAALNRTPHGASRRPAAEYGLGANLPLRLEDAGGYTVEALEGTSWITAYGQRTDVMLRPGQRFVVPNDMLTLVEAIGASRVRIAAPAARPSWLHGVARQGRARLTAGLDKLRQGLRPAASADFPG